MAQFLMYLKAFRNIILETSLLILLKTLILIFVTTEDIPILCQI